MIIRITIFLYHHRVNPNPFQSSRSYYLNPGRFPAVPVPLMDIPVPAWLYTNQPTPLTHARQFIKPRQFPFIHP